MKQRKQRQREKGEERWNEKQQQKKRESYDRMKKMKAFRKGDTRE